MSRGIQVGNTSLGSIGKRFGGLVITGVDRRYDVISQSGKRKQRIIYAARCDCGRMTTVNSHKMSKRKYCAACQQDMIAAARARKPPKKPRPAGYGGTGHELYSVWREMLKRCYYLKHPKNRCYGGRGITVCDRWRNSFLDFVADMGPRPEGMTLDRIDPNGNYEPANCRWATPLMQANNRRNNLLYNWNDEHLTLQQWADRWGVDVRAILVAMKLRIPFGVIAKYRELDLSAFVSI